MVLDYGNFVSTTTGKSAIVKKNKLHLLPFTFTEFAVSGKLWGRRYHSCTARGEFKFLVDHQPSQQRANDY